MFQSYSTIFRPAFIDMRYNQCISYTMGSDITYKVFCRLLMVLNYIYLHHVGNKGSHSTLYALNVPISLNVSLKMV